MSRSKRFIKDYWFILSMLTGIIAGCIVGAVWPEPPASSRSEPCL